MPKYDLDQLRFRALRGDGLCYTEHEVYKSEDGRMVGVRCAGVEIDRMDLGEPTAADRSDDIRSFFQVTLANHERKVAADVVAWLIQTLEEVQ